MKCQKVCTTCKRKNVTPYIQHGIMGRPLYVPLVLLISIKNKLIAAMRQNATRLVYGIIA
jgi:hypothetical protein